LQFSIFSKVYIDTRVMNECDKHAKMSNTHVSVLVHIIVILTFHYRFAICN